MIYIIAFFIKIQDMSFKIIDYTFFTWYKKSVVLLLQKCYSALKRFISIKNITTHKEEEFKMRQAENYLSIYNI